MIDITRHIEKARQVHGDWYDYSHITNPHIRYTDKVTIVCPKHGPFQQTLNSHHKGSGCPACGREKHTNKRIANINEQLSKCKLIHDNKYDYSLITKNVRALQKVNIICPKHGMFQQRLNDHINGHGCPVCASEQRTISNRKSRSQAVEKTKQTNKERYGCEYNQKHITKYALQCLNDRQWLYDQHYQQQKTLVSISEHLGVSDRLVGIYLHSHGLETQNFAVSDQELQVRSFIDSLGVSYTPNSRKTIPPYELDILIPEYNVAIEYCGLYWHSESQGKHRLYHKTKHDLCAEQGIQLLTIFEDEWVKRTEIVKDKLRSVLQQNAQRTVYARNTTITTVSTKQKQLFYEQNHIQGSGPGSITYGLISDNQLVACCSFSKKNDLEYYLTRYATNCNVVGGFSKLVKHFTKNHNWKLIISFADLRWSNGNLYEQTGWTLDKTIPPDYFYVTNGVNRKHKFGFRRKFLHRKLPHFDPTLSEKQNCDNNGLLRIWDCGKLRYVLTP